MKLMCIDITGSSRPTLRKLLNTRVIANASSRWYQLGIQLLDDDQVAQLENIKENNADVTERCTALLRYWLRMHPSASWYELVAAMRAPGVELNKLAVAVEENFTGLLRCIGTLQTCTYTISVVSFSRDVQYHFLPAELVLIHFWWKTGQYLADINTLP